MKRVLFTIVFCLSVLSDRLVRASEYAADWLYLGAGARAAGMGWCGLTGSGEAESCYWNPAVDYSRGGPALMGEQASLFQGLETYNALFQKLPVGRLTGLSAGFIRNSVDDIPLYGELQGNLDPTNPEDRYTDTPEGWGRNVGLAYFLNAAHSHEFVVIMGQGLVPSYLPASFTWGLNLKYLSETFNLDYNTGSRRDVQSTGLSTDLGLQLKVNGPTIAGKQSQKALVVGMVVRNFSGGYQSWESTETVRERLHRDLQFGARWTAAFDGSISGFSAALERFTYRQDLLHLGLEVEVKEHLALRLGAYGNRFKDLETTLGAGLRVWRFQVDYAWLRHSHLGLTQRLSLTYRHR